MKFSAFFFTLLATAFITFAQEDTRIHYANSITAGDLGSYLSVLASDSLEGREATTRGQHMAAAFIAVHFQKAGLHPAVSTPEGPSWFQQFDLVRIRPATAYIVIDRDTLKNLHDFIYTGQDTYNEPLSGRPVFLEKHPKKEIPAEDIKDRDVIICCAGSRTERETLATALDARDVRNVFIITDDEKLPFNTLLNRYRRFMSYGRLYFPEKVKLRKGYFLIPPAVGARMLDITATEMSKMMERYRQGKRFSMKNSQPAEITYSIGTSIDTVQTENVLAVIEGTDKKDEYLFITAHYDHLGTRDGEVYNGADDNASGTSAMMEIAEAFALAKKDGHGPRRTVVFMAMTGEEKGLLGSSYYISHPLFPLKKTIADLNIDMAGRVDEQHEDNPDYIYLIGSDKLSSQLHRISEQCNDTYSQLTLDYTYNDDNDPNRFYYRSDHYNFAKNNIPVIFYFNGTHEDYHRKSDTIDKINFPLLEKRTKLVFYTAWELANMDERIKPDPEKAPPAK